jgi:hypothetical protein
MTDGSRLLVAAGGGGNRGRAGLTATLGCVLLRRRRAGPGENKVDRQRDAERLRGRAEGAPGDFRGLGSKQKQDGKGRGLREEGFV